MLASGINCFKINLDTTSAVNKLNNTPSASTSPNPLTIPEPKKYSVNATINVVTFPSIIVLIAFLKLFSKAFPDATFFASSSFNLSNIITFASTAIPIDRIKPAIPESVNDIPVFEITNNNIETYIIKAIGDPTKLERTLLGNGGYVEELRNYGFTVDIDKGKVSIPKYSKEIGHKYIQ